MQIEAQRVKEAAMPEVSLFGGIRITMYHSGHNPPHFHAQYGGYKATFRKR